MKKSKSKNLLLLVMALVLSMAFLSYFGSKQETQAVEPRNPAAETAAPTEQPTPEPTPEPTPTPPEKSDPIFFEGEEMDTYLVNGDQCIKVSEAAERLGCADAGENTIVVRNETTQFDSDYVEIKEFCDKAKIGVFQPEENGTIYCTVAAGEWELPQGYNVPVFMYHGVGSASDAANLFVKTAEFEKQCAYLVENGYTPIWFEDLWNVENIEKPVILVFDDGWRNNYTDAFPILQKYNVKATIAIVPDFVDQSSQHLTSDMIQEMKDSGLVRFESHTMSHDYLYDKSKESQRWELEESRKVITEMIGYQPIVLVYPSGTNTNYVTDTLIDEEQIYRFGVMMVGYRSYNTSDDPAIVYRFWPQRDTPLESYARWLETTFPESDTSETTASATSAVTSTSTPKPTVTVAPSSSPTAESGSTAVQSTSSASALSSSSAAASNSSNAGFEDCLASIHSHLDGSDENRMENIRLAIEKVNGQIIQSGEVFSFNDCVGPTTKENGYSEAYIYCNNGHYPEDEVTELGGGVNQVASVIYCASLHGVLEPVERTAHHFAFATDGYLRRGEDAYTCNNGIEETKDLKIQNTYDDPVLIKVWIDEEDNLLCAELYGTNPEGLRADVGCDLISHYLQAKPDVCYLFEATSYRTIYNNNGCVGRETLFTDMYYWHERDYVWT